MLYNIICLFSKACFCPSQSHFPWKAKCSCWRTAGFCEIWEQREKFQKILKHREILPCTSSITSVSPVIPAWRDSRVGGQFKFGVCVRPGHPFMMYNREYILPLEAETHGCKLNWLAAVVLACNTKLGKELFWKICQFECACHHRA